MRVCVCTRCFSFSSRVRITVCSPAKKYKQVAVSGRAGHSSRRSIYRRRRRQMFAIDKSKVESTLFAFCRARAGNIRRRCRYKRRTARAAMTNIGFNTHTYIYMFVLICFYIVSRRRCRLVFRDLISRAHDGHILLSFLAPACVRPSSSRVL